MARRRFEYLFETNNLSHSIVPNPFVEVTWRNPSVADQQILAELMLDSYQNTIDYDGETIEDAVHEVASYFSSQDSIWLDNSWLAFIENNLTCASLVGFWKDRNAPIIAYMMTASRWKGKHLATIGVSHSLHSLAETNYTQVYAVITEGNFPSERVFTRMGFKCLSPTK